MNMTNVDALSMEEQARLFQRLLRRAEAGEVAISGSTVSPAVLVSLLRVSSMESQLLFGQPLVGLSLLGLALTDVHLSTPRRQLDQSASFFADLFSQKDFAMKLPSQCRGWEAKMREKGFAVKTKARFGQLEHVISWGSMSVTVIQGTTALVRNRNYIGLMLDPVIAALKSAGAIVLLDTKAKDKEIEEEYAD